MQFSDGGGQPSLATLQVGPASVHSAVGAPPTTRVNSLPWSTRIVLLLNRSLLVDFLI
jgi:hypothetical protein